MDTDNRSRKAHIIDEPGHTDDNDGSSEKPTSTKTPRLFSFLFDRLLEQLAGRSFLADRVTLVRTVAGVRLARGQWLPILGRRNRRNPTAFDRLFHLKCRIRRRGYR